MSTHKRVVCSCGAVIMQCKCFHCHKTTETVVNGCDVCKQQPSPAARQRLRATREQLEDLYVEQRLSATKIARLFGVTDSCVLYNLAKQGIPRRSARLQKKVK